ncbi:hypothetical protein L1887_19784 [Cichorium endivia]|nr:hypothetical protein L1887_19784 [Cichorium endivia]
MWEFYKEREERRKKRQPMLRGKSLSRSSDKYAYDSLGGKASCFYFTNFTEQWNDAYLCKTFRMYGKVKDSMALGWVRRLRMYHVWVRRLRMNSTKYERKEKQLLDVRQKLKSVVVKSENLKKEEIIRDELSNAGLVKSKKKRGEKSVLAQLPKNRERWRRG